MTLPWDKFAELTGDSRRNLEVLARALVQRRYGRYGQIRSRRNQPGVEFHLRILLPGCELGDEGRWFGWQCKWYDLPKDRSLGENRCSEIESAIKAAKHDIPDLTDFVLVLRELPRKADLDWYFALNYDLQLHLWADEELQARLVADAETLRRAFFGELVLTPEELDSTRSRAVAPVEHRWVPHLHVPMEAERSLQAALARPTSGHAVRDRAHRLRWVTDELRSAQGSLGQDSAIGGVLDRTTNTLSDLADHLNAIAEGVETRRPDVAAMLLADPGPDLASVRDFRQLARRLGAIRHPAALAASNAEPEIRDALQLLADNRVLIKAPMIAVVGPAGRGKTQLAAEITAAGDGHPAGVFIRGSDLRTGGTLHSLAAKVPGAGTSRFDDLLAAVDAAGARSGTRVPIVIDGLNEAERPSEWRDLLAQVRPVLPDYPNVLVVVTLRGEVLQDALPEGCLTLELKWLKFEVEEAARRYFEHYLIYPGSARLPMGRFADPLFLRMYCEATNGDRIEAVGVEKLPASLVAVFELYRGRIAERLRVQPGRVTLPPGHIERQLRLLAMRLWETNERDMPYEEAKALLDGANADDWDNSLYRRLEEEGVLSREDQHGPAGQRTSILFDRFAGYLIADALLADLSLDDVERALGDTELWDRVAGGAEARHPLGQDVLVALASLLPRRFYNLQLWKVAPDASRQWALGQALYLESELLDASTVGQLTTLVQGAPRPTQYQVHPFDRLWELHDGANHRLNASFLDDVLRPLPVAERDATWTEWVRLRAADVMNDLDELDRYWTGEDTRDDTDDLEARAVAWLLTSTHRSLRDAATRALQRYGRPDPGRLFALAADLLDVNDPYVTERLLAAALGAALAHQMPDPGGPFERALGRWLDELARRYVAPGATTPTSHFLAREYAAVTFGFAASLHPAAMPEPPLATPQVFETGDGARPRIAASEGDAAQDDETIRIGMDFENYVLGRLYEDRGNYQTDHPAYAAGLRAVRHRVLELGWRADLFEDIDRSIRDDQWRRRQEPHRVERYAKKYGWIAYHELAGWLFDQGELRRRRFGGGLPVAPDIDPTFPAEPPKVSDMSAPWVLTQQPADEWLRDGPVELPASLLVPDEVDGIPGPWVLVEGFLMQEDPEGAREIFGFVRGFLIDKDRVDALSALLMTCEYPGNHLVPDVPSDTTTFAGEIPWSGRFASDVEPDDEEGGETPYVTAVRESWDEPGIPIELLGHEYAFPSSRSVTALDSAYDVASKAFAEAFQLRQLPGHLDLVALDGSPVSLVRRPPGSSTGHLLYLRRDLIGQYADGRELTQFVWGERRVLTDWDDESDWLLEILRAHDHVWRFLETIDLG